MNEALIPVPISNSSSLSSSPRSVSSVKHENNRSLIILMLSVLLGSTGYVFLLPYLVTIKAQWYTKCDLHLDEDCEPNYREAQKWSGFFDSLRAFVTFFVAALVGRVSDAIGRKPVLVFGSLVNLLPIAALVFTNGDSPIAYFTCSVLSGLSGSNGGTAVINAYVADITVSHSSRFKSFGTFGVIASLSLVASPLLSYLASSLDDHTSAIIALVILLLNVLLVIVFVDESLPATRRNVFVWSRTLNPFSSLKLIERSSFVFWMAVLTLFTSLPDTGVVEIALFYCDDVLGLKNQEAKEFNSLYLGLTGIFGVVAQAGILRYLLKKNVHILKIIYFGIVMNVLHMALYASLYAFPHKYILYINSVVTGLYFLLQPSTNALLANHMGPLEQGFSQGTIAAVRGLTGAVGPFTFSQIYNSLPTAPYVAFLVGVFMGLISLVVAIWPLSNVVKSSKSSNALLFSHSQTYGHLGIGGVAMEDENSIADEDNDLQHDQYNNNMVRDDDDNDEHEVNFRLMQSATSSVTSAYAQHPSIYE